MSEGWIKIQRSLTGKGWANRPEYVALWVHLLLMANHKNSEYFWNGKTIILKAGQLITGRKILSEVSGISQTTVERILKTFENEQQIGQQKTSTSRLISILNWDKYQKVGQHSGQRADNGWTTDGQRMDTKEECNNDKNDKNDKKGVFTPPTPDQVQEYFFEIGVNGQEFEKFHDHYQANGWKIAGKTKMKDWKAACRNWKRNIEKFKNDTNGKQPKSARSEMDKLRDWYESVNAPTTGSGGE